MRSDFSVELAVTEFTIPKLNSALGYLAKSRGSTPAQQRLWREEIYEHIQELMPLQGRLSIEHLCQLVAVRRRCFYRSLQQREPAEEEAEVRSLIQEIALKHCHRYGYRQITAELHRRGVPVNRKKVARMMRDDNLLAIQPKRFVVTTISKHKWDVHLNLARRMRLTGAGKAAAAKLRDAGISAKQRGLGRKPSECHLVSARATGARRRRFEIENILKKAVKVLSPAQLWVNPDCDLKTRRWDEVRPALAAMVEAARAMRQSAS